jgi:hypothetical protein
MPSAGGFSEDFNREEPKQSTLSSQARAARKPTANRAPDSLLPSQWISPDGQLVQEALGRLYAQLLEAASGAAVHNLLGALTALLPQLAGGCGEQSALANIACQAETELDLSAEAPLRPYVASPFAVSAQ